MNCYNLLVVLIKEEKRKEEGNKKEIKMSLKQLATSLKLRKERSNDDLEEAASSDRRPSCQGLDTVEKDGIFEGYHFCINIYLTFFEIELISFEINNKNRNSSQNLSLESRRKSIVL